MSRFSIRTQIAALSGAFLLLLLTVLGGSWLVKSSMHASILMTRDVVEQANIVNLIKEDIEQARHDLVLYTSGNSNAFGSLVDNLAEVREQLIASEVLFLEPTTAKARNPEAFATLAQGLELTREIETSVTEMIELAANERRFFSTLNVIPRIAELSGYLEDLQATLKESAALAKATGDAVAERSYVIQGIVAVLATIGAILIGVFGGRALANPVLRLERAVNRIAERDYDTEVDGTARGDELGKIARALDNLRGDLAAAQDAQQKEQETNDRRIFLFETLGSGMSDLKEGTLDTRVDPDGWSDLGSTYERLCRDFNGLADGLQDMVEAMRESAQNVESNAENLSGMSDGMSQRAELQAATLEESAAALEQLSKTVQSSAERAQEADSQVSDGRQRAEDGQAVMQSAMEAMTSIATSSEKITRIIGVIDDIAFQTNLLALNAGVEAARAGESGSGFSVVASEVRSLAQRASASAQEIKDLVNSSRQQVSNGEKLVGKTGETLADIVDSVKAASNMVTEIASSAKEQATALSEINAGVADLDRVTQQNAAMVSETLDASQQLNGEATRLTGLLARYRRTHGAEQSTPEALEIRRQTAGG